MTRNLEKFKALYGVESEKYLGARGDKLKSYQSGKCEGVYAAASHILNAKEFYEFREYVIEEWG